MGRKSKLPKFLEAMKEVFASHELAKVMSKSSLRKLANSKLPIKDRVSVSTFEFWTTDTINHTSPENNKTLDQDLVLEFRALLEDFNVMGELNMLEAALDPESKINYMYDKLLPRLYPHYRVNQSVNIGAGQNGSIQITVGEESHKNLIDNIIHGTPIIDIPHEEIQEKPKQIEE